MRLIVLLSLCLLSAPAFAGPCPPAGQTKASLQTLKTAKFEVPDAVAKRALAQALLGCLSSPDPDLRDGIAYEALTQWMRAGDFDADALRTMRDTLYGMLDGADEDGFRKPFAALSLSEVARTDRIKPWMTADERVAMVERAAAYLESVRDYRGYTEGEGWRHGVAHGADWLMQLSLNPALERAQYERILAAIAAQAVPQNGHAYVFGEPERLAKPLLFTAQRGLLSAEDWQTWFNALPAKVGTFNRADYPAWLGRRHDLTALLTRLYWETDQSEDEAIKALKPAIAAALKQMR